VVTLFVSGIVTVAIFAVAPITLAGVIHAIAASGQRSCGGG
jgi:hypothetical protein